MLAHLLGMARSTLALMKLETNIQHLIISCWYIPPVEIALEVMLISQAHTILTK